MPVDFLSDSEAAKYGRSSRAEMEKIFFLDNEDMALIKGHRGRHIRCGFALQLVTVRYLGCFLADPLEVPNEVLDVVAAQLGIEDPSCVKRYTERDKTRLEHTWEIAKAFGLKDFASAEDELAGKVRAHAWNIGDGPTACFQSAVRWLRQNDVLLPGTSTLTRLVARERGEVDSERLGEPTRGVLGAHVGGHAGKGDLEPRRGDDVAQVTVMVRGPVMAV
ncbi:DUF4158 domain-containing protein [Streptosporangium amethystogenes]|uniref:DUF4158 domain-containing protein n=1 Tax=Streptosporangium amethystogenes TaxID=2002 RepID=UPI00068BDB6F|nr:DUF4158 domain-containing protein [Streptosporangium amethystogenes]